jgi:hypothetical protein
MSVSIGAQANTDRLLGCFLDVQNGTALVCAAFGAGTMRELLLMAVGAFGNADSSEKVVRTAKRGAARRMAPFRIRHDKFLSCLRELLVATGTTSQPNSFGGTPSIS